MSLLQIKQLNYQVGEQKILSDIYFSLEQGDWLTLSGPSGSGKSSLLKIIASLLSPTTGEIYFEGKEQKTYDPMKYRQQVSYCFQNPTLFGTDVKENLAFPFLVRNRPFNQEQVEAALKQVALEANFLEKKVTALSGGERQRVALLRNLLFLPKILLLDEVTVGLDWENKELIQNLLTSVHQQGVALLQITHDESELAQAKKTIILKEGKLLV